MHIDQPNATTFTTGKLAFAHRSRSQPDSLRLSREWTLKYDCKMDFILRLLIWAGLLTNPDKSFRNKILFCVFSVCYLLVIVDFLISIFISVWNKNFLLKIHVLQMMTYVMSILTWYAMRQKRKLFTSLVSLMNNAHPFKLAKFEKFILFFICSTPIIFAFTIAIGITFLEQDQYIKYGSIMNLYLRGTVLTLKHLITSLVFPTWANLLVLIYYRLCKTVCLMIRDLTEEIEKCSVQDFTPSKQANIINQELKINRVVQYLQEIFSVSSFLLSIAHFGICISVLGLLFKITIANISLHFAITLLLNLANSFAGLMTCLWMAGGLPVEASKFKEAFRRKINQRLMFLHEEEDIFFEKCLPDISSYLLSGCNIIYFQRSSILAVVGTLLSYTFLLIN
ncbi:hypothetical protein HNY73_002476 [Argiope bruennichi]|uniref:Uncharacterized protein n=1 Tax=Argiope bruennichi TaxID=94029 RepID=A0A8T0FTS7_ARGBR|nr:hypothetical protein HNY73_002476 [Argiope bruennichi]